MRGESDGGYCLFCPNCGEAVFERARNWYGEDEEEKCSDCGHALSIGIDGDDAYVRDRTEEGLDDPR